MALGFDQRGLLVDHLLQDLLIDAELPQQLVVEAAAVRGPVRLHLRVVALLELAGGQPRPSTSAITSRGRRADADGRRIVEKARNVEDDERQHHEGKAPLEPALVPTHPVEHGHELKSFRLPAVTAALDIGPPSNHIRSYCALTAQSPKPYTVIYLTRLEGLSGVAACRCPSAFPPLRAVTSISTQSDVAHHMARGARRLDFASHVKASCVRSGRGSSGATR